MILIHARDDRDIPWSHSDALFYAAANATGEEGGLSRRQVDGVKERVDWGRGAGWRNTWTVRGVEGGRKRVRQVVVRYGGEYRGLFFLLCLEVRVGAARVEGLTRCCFF